MSAPAFEAGLCEKCGVGNGFHFAGCPTLKSEWECEDEVFFVYPRFSGQCTLIAGTVVAAGKSCLLVWSTVIPDGQPERTNWVPRKDCRKTLAEAEALLATRNNERR